MAGVSLSYISIFLFLSFGLAETYFTQYFKQYTFNTQKYIKLNKNKLSVFTNNSELLFFCIISHCLNYYSLKISCINFLNIINFFNVYFYIILLSIFCCNIVFLQQNVNKQNNNYLFLVTTSLILCVYYYTWCTNYILLLLTLETVTTLYYFFFLKNSSTASFSLIKYKNLISYYLWLSFFTLIFFTVNLLIFIYLFGTINFTELQFFYINQKISTLMLIGFFWKLGMPSFHFFKLELYRYLDFFNLILFSIISLIINSLLFIFLLYTLNIILTYNNILLIICCFLNIFLLIQSVDKIYFYYFFAISGINTWLFFLILLIS